MPKTFEELRSEYLAKEKQKDDEVAAVKKKFEKELAESHKQVIEACDHALVVEERVEKYHSPHEIRVDFDTGPLRGTEPLMRICCLCGCDEAPDHLSKEFKALTAEPFRYFCPSESRLFIPTAMEYCRMPLPKLRKEAVRLRKEQKKEGER